MSLSSSSSVSHSAAMGSSVSSSSSDVFYLDIHNRCRRLASQVFYFYENLINFSNKLTCQACHQEICCEDVRNQIDQVIAYCKARCQPLDVDQIFGDASQDAAKTESELIQGMLSYWKARPDWKRFVPTGIDDFFATSASSEIKALPPESIIFALRLDRLRSRGIEQSLVNVVELFTRDDANACRMFISIAQQVSSERLLDACLSFAKEVTGYEIDYRGGLFYIKTKRNCFEQLAMCYQIFPRHQVRLTLNVKGASTLRAFSQLSAKPIFRLCFSQQVALEDQEIFRDFSEKFTHFFHLVIDCPNFDLNALDWMKRSQLRSLILTCPMLSSLASLKIPRTFNTLKLYGCKKLETLPSANVLLQLKEFKWKVEKTSVSFSHRMERLFEAITHGKSVEDVTKVMQFLQLENTGWADVIFVLFRYSTSRNNLLRIFKQNYAFPQFWIVFEAFALSRQKVQEILKIKTEGDLQSVADHVVSSYVQMIDTENPLKFFKMWDGLFKSNPIQGKILAACLQTERGKQAVSSCYLEIKKTYEKCYRTVLEALPPSEEENTDLYPRVWESMWEEEEKVRKKNLHVSAALHAPSKQWRQILDELYPFLTSEEFSSLKVTYEGSPAIDAGGLARDFLFKLANAISKEMNLQEEIFHSSDHQNDFLEKLGCFTAFLWDHAYQLGEWIHSDYFWGAAMISLVEINKTIFQENPKWPSLERLKEVISALEMTQKNETFRKLFHPSSEELEQGKFEAFVEEYAIVMGTTPAGDFQQLLPQVQGDFFADKKGVYNALIAFAHGWGRYRSPPDWIRGPKSEFMEKIKSFYGVFSKEELKKSVRYRTCADEIKEAVSRWIETKSEEELRSFLVTVTSSSVIPASGLVIQQKNYTSKPVIHTCFNQIDLPVVCSPESVLALLDSCCSSSSSSSSSFNAI